MTSGSFLLLRFQSEPHIQHLHHPVIGKAFLLRRASHQHQFCSGMLCRLYLFLVTTGFSRLLSDQIPAVKLL